ncbi:MAG: hypothetical protein V3R93_04450 [Candidatus Hydrothermarchaeaceae archaeon]
MMDVKDAIRNFYDSLTLQHKLCKDIREEVPVEDVNRAVDVLANYLKRDGIVRRIHVISKGRSRLSTLSPMQWLYNQCVDNNPFAISTLEDSIVQHLSNESLAIINSASGETDKVNKYLKEAIKRKSELFLITEDEEAAAYRLVETAGGLTIVLGSTRKSDSELTEKYEDLLPLGSPFEYQSMIFLDSLIPEVVKRIEGTYDGGCSEYYRMLDALENSVKLVCNRGWVEDGFLRNWIYQLTDRHGEYIFCGFSRSGHIADEIKIRFRHLVGPHVCTYGGSDQGKLKTGDVLFIVSGTGNTLDVIDAAKDALCLYEEGGELKRKSGPKQPIDIFGISANPNSLLRGALATVGQQDNLLLVPVPQEYEELYEELDIYVIESNSKKVRHPIFENVAYVTGNAIISALEAEKGVIGQVHFKEEHQ